MRVEKAKGGSERAQGKGKERKREVVKDVDLVVKKGEVVGLLGPNGAGKTTTFYMITGIIRPNQGTVKYNDENISIIFDD